MVEHKIGRANLKKNKPAIGCAQAVYSVPIIEWNKNWEDCP